MSSAGAGNVHILPSYSETRIPDSLIQGRRKVVIALDQSEVSCFYYIKYFSEREIQFF